jgi:hypothetical protein
MLARKIEKARRRLQASEKEGRSLWAVAGLSGGFYFFVLIFIEVFVVILIVFVIEVFIVFKIEFFFVLFFRGRQAGKFEQIVVQHGDFSPKASIQRNLILRKP